MKAADVMNTPVIAASAQASCREIALYMLLGGFSGVPIVEPPEGLLVGIVTEVDLLRALRCGRSLDQTLAAEIMTRQVITVDVTTPVEAIVEVFDSERILRVPVLDGGRMVGIVSRPDLLRAAVQPQFLRVG
jgi:CBS domain-containing protein